MTAVLANIAQANRLIQATTPPGTVGMVPVRVVGTEELSSPFLYTVDFLAADPDVGPEKMLGKPIGLTFAPAGFSKRHVHGIVRRWTDLGVVGALGFTQYQAEIVPSLWLLTLSSDCRTFENKSVPFIVDAVLKAAGVTNFAFRIAVAPGPVPYVTQYQESDFAFVSRLLEEAGLYYTFTHAAAAAGHTLVISDSFGRGVPDGDLKSIAVAVAALGGGSGKGPATSIGNTLGENAGQKVGDAVSQIAGAKLGGVIGAGVGTIIGPLGTLAGGALGTVLGGLVESLLGSSNVAPPAGDTVQTVQRQRAVHTHTYAARDFHLLRAADSDTASSTRPGVAGTRFEYLGDLSGSDTKGVATVTTTRRIETEETQGDLVRGTSTAASLTAGTRVTVTGGVLGSGGLELHVTHVAHVAEINGVLAGTDLKAIYLNEFVAIPAATRYRPARVTARPSVRGTQTALVVGSGAVGEIDVDKDGRVLLQFPWDRGAGADKQSEHRVHVATLWAGTGWGGVHLPRIGQEVLVEFLEGDPDRPIVTGRVYSNNHDHPYALPANKTQSGVKSRSVGGTAENFNELRFEDKKGAEQVFLQAEKNLQVKVKASEARSVGGTRTANVYGDDTHEVTKGNQVLHVKTGDQSFLVDAGNRKVTVSDDDTKTAKFIGMEATDQIEATVDSSVIRMGSSGIRSVAKTIHAEGKQKLELIVGESSITLEPAQIVLKMGPSTVTLSADGVKVEGVKVDVNGKAMTSMTGPMVTIEGKAMTEIKGAMTQVMGNAMLTARGAISMIG